MLFLNFCLLFACLRLSKFLGDFSFLLASVAIQYTPINILGAGLVKWHFIFFVTGYLFVKYKSLIWKWPLQLSSVISFPVLSMTWYRTREPHFFLAFRNFFSSHHIGRLGLILSLYTFAVPFMGIAIVYFLIPKLGRFRFYALLSWLGTVTLDIYVSQQIFLMYSVRVGEGAFMIFISFLMALSLSLGLAFLLQQSKILSLLFLGRSRTSDYKINRSNYEKIMQRLMGLVGKTEEIPVKSSVPPH